METVAHRGSCHSPNTEHLLALSQEIAHLGHWHWVIENRSIVWSAELYRIVNLNPDEFAPDIDNIRKLIHRADLGILMQGLQRAILEQRDFDMEFRITRKDGDIRHVSCAGRVATNQDGDVTELYGIVQDITERIEKEQELRRAKESVERAYAAKSQFLANMSHELRTPLNAVIGFSDMMERELLGKLGNSKYKEYVTGIKKSGQHLLCLISDILDMSKIEAGKYELFVEDLLLHDMIASVTQIMRARAKEAGIKITIQHKKEDIPFRGDRRAITQIMLNLLSNAVKFSQAKDTITVQTFARDTYLLIRVIDEGCGIPATKLPYVMRPFEQVSDQYERDHEGSGLGLAISKELVDLHGGTLHIESHVGHGTTVSVRLPYDAACLLDSTSPIPQAIQA